MSTDHAKCALITPEPYKGDMPDPREPERQRMSVIEVATYFDLPPLMVRQGKWAVSRRGIHYLQHSYDIPKEALDTEDWVAHMSEKTWADPGEFATILQLAKEMVELEMI